SGFDMYPGNTYAATFATSGYVGIGTTSPAERLDVSGNIRGSGAIYSTGGQIYTQYPGGYSQTALNQWGLSSPGTIYIEAGGGTTLYLTDSWAQTGTMQVQFGLTNFASGNVQWQRSYLQ